MSKYPLFNRDDLKFKSVTERESKIFIDAAIAQARYVHKLNTREWLRLQNLAARIKEARINDKPVILCMGAHAIKNGACSIINDLVSRHLITHVASNGAAAIHDWEFARFGKSTECVRTNIENGEFGMWQETGQFFGVAAECACEDKQGWGEKIGELINNGITFGGGSYRYPDRSVMANCDRAKVPYTIHPGIGQDIVYGHTTITGNVGCTVNDFLIFCEAVHNVEGGVYLSVGSSVMSPMIFEKALSMARNVEKQRGNKVTNFLIAVNDIADNNWDWDQGEPPVDNPAYYVRFMKSFHRTGGELAYYGLHNTAFLRHLQLML